MIKLVFLSVIIITLLFLYINIYHKETFIDNKKKWENYRLGDIYKYYTDLKHEKVKYGYINSIPSKYHGSIGAEYVLKNESKNINFNLLLKIVNERTKKMTYSPNSNELILHLRIGDAIQGYNSKTDKFDYLSNYATKLETLTKNINIFKNKRVIIFYGNHVSRAKKKYSELYLTHLRQLFKNNNIKFEETSNGDPDEDFLIMCNAKTFIKSGGGYSNLIAQVVRHKKNKVIELT
jgi:hypothetical protein